MSSHWRVVLFCVSLLAAPLLWNLGKDLGADLAGALIAVGVVSATALYANAGQPKPPAGGRPAGEEGA